MNFVMIRVLGMQPASQAILSFPISAAALVGGTYLGDALSGSATSRGKTMFDVEGETKAPFSVSGWFGVVWAVGSLWAFIICSFCESALPKPANMFIFLFLMMSFVLGCYFAVPALVPGDDEENAPATGVGASLTQKIVGSGWTWLGVYVVAIGLMFAVYRIATPDPGRAQLTSARIEVRDIAAALAAYKEQHGAYPATDALIPSLQEKRLDENMKGKPYLRGGLDQTDAWGNPIVYEAQNGGSYVLYSPGPDGKPGTEDDIHPPTAGE
jgi:general secretion pathway protein G